MSPRSQKQALEVVAALELIPGHPATAAEVWLWHGPAAGPRGDEDAEDDHRIGAGGSPRVVLRADDWPMHAESARQLALALLGAAERAESATAPARRRPQPPAGTVPGGSVDADSRE